MKKITLGSLLCLSFMTLTVSAQKNLIPIPREISVGKDTFPFKKLRVLSSDQSTETTYLTQQWEAIHGEPLPRTKSKPTLILLLDSSTITNKEAYQLQINASGVEIKAGSEQGLFYGVQTLLQLIEEHSQTKSLPYLKINDEPDFAYRGMHLDVCRHFFSIDEVKRFLDHIARYKINKFHWHLTDDQGWRIEIKSHPKLTAIGAFRKRMPFDGDEHGDANVYGGFYTQEQVKEVVAYAAKLHIEVIPEIEMPGHAQAALAAYPELSCTGGPFEVGVTWGVMEDVFCPKEETFALLEDVIDEVIPLFPSSYIHIGGDEAPKTRWKACSHCQELIKREGLKDEHELQSYFITRMEKYINAKGKKIIGWDEILEGGLAPNATVMSWTGIEGGIQAAKSGHDAIMTPASHVYFDYYQGNPQTEPLAFSADLRLEKVYSYEPIPSSLEEEERKHVLGVQANMWTEYMPNFKQVEHMLFPRLLALSEVAWGTAKSSEYKNFEGRVIAQLPWLDRRGIHYSKAIYEVNGEISKADGELYYSLSTAKDAANIRYTVDGSDPSANSPAYTGPISVKGISVIKAAYFERGEKISSITEQVFVQSKAIGKRVMLNNPAHKNYTEGGPESLVDGVLGSHAFHKKHWLGFIPNDVVATIDLEQPTAISKVGISVLENKGIGVHYPAAVVVQISNDGKSFQQVKVISADDIRKEKGFVKLDIGEHEARYVRFEMKSGGKIAEGNPLAGSDSWIFTDELTID